MPLSRFPDTTVGPDVVRGWIKTAMRRAPFYIGAFLAAWYLFAKSMQALLLVLAALIGARALRFGSALHRRRLRADAGGAARLRAAVPAVHIPGVLAHLRGHRRHLRDPRRQPRRRAARHPADTAAL